MGILKRSCSSMIIRLFIFGTVVQAGFLFLLITVYWNNWTLILKSFPRRYQIQWNSTKQEKSQPSPQQYTKQYTRPHTYDYSKFNKSSPSYKIQPVLSISKMKIPELLPDFKNPCWNDEHEERLLCVPYFYLAGFPKCGTSDLYSRLVAHPLIVSPVLKEAHYLSRHVFASRQCRNQVVLNDSYHDTCAIREYATRFIGDAATDIMNNVKAAETESKDEQEKAINFAEERKLLGYSRHIIKYLSRRFKAEWEEIRHKAAESWKHPMITIDGSASLIWDNSHWNQIKENQGCTEPVYLISDLLLKINPNAYIIVLLREPVQRAFSDFLYFSRYSLSKEIFHNHTVQAIGQFKACLRQHSLRQCTLDAKSQSDEGRVRPHVGLYHVYIREWFRRIPRERFLFVRTETYGADIPKTLKRIFEFLKLPSLSVGAIETIQQQTKVLKNPHKSKMMPETQDLLSKFYAQHNRKLAELLGDEAFLWKDLNHKIPSGDVLYDIYY